MGRCNEPLNEPFLNVLACASETIVQYVAIIYPNDTCSPSGSDQPEPLTEIVAPTGPEEGLLLMLPVVDTRCACTGETRCAVEENTTERQNSTLVARQTLLTSLARYFITKILTNVFYKWKHICTIAVNWNFLSPRLKCRWGRVYTSSRGVICTTSENLLKSRLLKLDVCGNV